jgi:hypothetical protein
VIEGTTSTTLATLIADNRGSASGSGIVPPSVLGPHSIQATGATSGAKAQAVYNVIPSIRLIPSSGTPGAAVSPSLRGFQRYEYVTIELASTGQDLKHVRVSSTGSANATTTNAFAIPRTLPPGEHTIRAIGQSSGAVATTILTVLPSTASLQSAASPSPTPSPSEVTQATATASPAPEPSPTATTEHEPDVVATPTSTALPEPTLTPEVTATATPAVPEAPAQTQPALDESSTPDPSPTATRTRSERPDRTDR